MPCEIVFDNNRMIVTGASVTINTQFLQMLGPCRKRWCRVIRRLWMQSGRELSVQSRVRYSLQGQLCRWPRTLRRKLYWQATEMECRNMQECFCIDLVHDEFEAAKTRNGYWSILDSERISIFTSDQENDHSVRISTVLWLQYFSRYFSDWRYIVQYNTHFRKHKCRRRGFGESTGYQWAYRTTQLYT